MTLDIDYVAEIVQESRKLPAETERVESRENTVNPHEIG